MDEVEALEIAVSALHNAKAAVERQIETLEAERNSLRGRMFAYEGCLIQLENILLDKKTKGRVVKHD